MMKTCSSSEFQTVPFNNECLEGFRKGLARLECQLDKHSSFLKVLNRLQSMKKISLVKNDKRPSREWKNKQTGEIINTLTKVNVRAHNVGILTGEVNNLLVIDVDVKDNGVEQFELYQQEFGQVDTLKVITPSGGFHLYFNYSADDAEANFITQNYVRNVARMKKNVDGSSVGIDIRANGGYVVAPPSSIGGVPYKIKSLREIVDIPLSLLKFLITNCVKKQVREQISVATDATENGKQLEVPSEYEFLITDGEIVRLLAELPHKYVDNYDDWLITTTCLKSLSKYELWEEWSKKSSEYNKVENDRQWNYNKGIIDINYLVWLLRQQWVDIKYIEEVKDRDRSVAHKVGDNDDASRHQALCK